MESPSNGETPQWTAEEAPPPSPPPAPVPTAAPRFDLAVSDTSMTTTNKTGDYNGRTQFWQLTQSQPEGKEDAYQTLQQQQNGFTAQKTPWVRNSANPKDEISMQAFTELCQQLRALGYEQEIGIESAPLVYRLLKDLLLATENYEQLSEHSQRSDKTVASLERKIRPLQDELNRLMHHNNEVSSRQNIGAFIVTLIYVFHLWQTQLHLHLIQVQEQADEQNRSLESKFKELESEYGRVNTLNGKLRVHVDEQSREIKRLEEQVARLRKRQEIGRSLDETYSNFSHGLSKKEEIESDFADKLRDSTERKTDGYLDQVTQHELEQELHHAYQKQSELEAKVEAFRRSNEEREQEIKRLWNESQRSSRENTNGDNEDVNELKRVNAQLRDQVRVLASELDSYENKLQRKNQELERVCHQNTPRADDLTLLSSVHRETIQPSHEHPTQSPVSKIPRLRNNNSTPKKQQSQHLSVDSFDVQNIGPDPSRRVAFQDVSCQVETTERSRMEHSRAESMQIDSEHESYKAMEEKLMELRQSEEFVRSSEAKYREQVQQLESDLESYRKRLKEKQQELSHLKELHDPNISVEAAELRVDVETMNEKIVDLESKLETKTSRNRDLQSQVESLQDELYTVQSDLESKASDLSSVKRQLAAAECEKKEESARRQNLESELKYFKNLVHERNNDLKETQQKLSSVQSERTRLREALQDGKSCVAAAEESTEEKDRQITNLRKELQQRDADIAGVNRRMIDLQERESKLREENHALRNQLLQMSSKQNEAERKKQHLEQEVKSLQETSRKCEKEKKELEHSSDENRSLMLHLERRNNALDTELKRLNACLEEERQSVSSLQQQRDDVKLRLRDKEKELKRANQALQVYDQERSSLRDQLDEANETVTSQKSNIEQLKRTLREKDHHVDNLESKVSNLESHVSNLQEELSWNQSNLEDVKQKARQHQEMADSSRQEVSAASEDLSAMTRENQRLMNELSMWEDRYNDLKQRYSSLEYKLGLYSQKVEDSQSEKGSLFESYRSVQQERDQLLTESRRTNQKLQQAEEAIEVLKERNKKLLSEVNRQRDLRVQAEESCKSLESTVDDLSQRLHLLENTAQQDRNQRVLEDNQRFSDGELSRQLAEKERKLSEANHRIYQLDSQVQQLSAKVETKDQYIRQLESRTHSGVFLEDPKIRGSLQVLERERDSLKEELRQAMQELSELTARHSISPEDLEGRGDREMDYNTLYAEYRSLKARCETLNKTVERQASTIVSLEARLNGLRYYAERYEQHLNEQEQHFSSLRESVERRSSS